MPPSERPLLIAVDMQVGFVAEPTRHVVPAVKRLIDGWLRTDLPLVLTRFHNRPDGPYERLLHWYKLRDEPETRIVPELDEFVGKARVLDKTGYTAFTPELDQLIERERISEVVVCGMDTDTCVLKTAADAFERDLIPWAVTDACASNGGAQWHDHAVQAIGRFIGIQQLIEIDTALTRWG